MATPKFVKDCPIKKCQCGLQTGDLVEKTFGTLCPRCHYENKGKA